MASSRESIASVLLLCGLPGSGKSTVSSNLVKLLYKSKRTNIPSYDRVTVIDYDDITMQQMKHAGKIQGDKYLSDAELSCWRKTRKIAAEKLTEELTLVQKERTTSLILMDDNFHLRTMRREMFKICQHFCTDEKFTVSFSVVMLNVDVSICLKRNRMRCQDRVEDDIILKMNGTIEKPDARKNYWEKSSLILSGNGLNAVNDIAQTISDAIRQPVAPPPPVVDTSEDRALTMKNEVHIADRVLRTLVGTTCRTEKSLSQKANWARKEILNQVRMGNISAKDECLREKFIEMISEDLSENLTEIIRETSGVFKI